MQSSITVGFLKSTEECIGLLLLGNSLRKSTYCSTSLVHVTGKLILYVEPFLPVYVSVDLSKTELSLSENCNFTGSEFWVIILVKRVRSLSRVNGVRRVNSFSLIRSVCSSLRVRSSISDKSENRETRGLSNSSVRSNGEESSSNSSNLSENLTTSISVYNSGNTSIVGLEIGNKSQKSGEFYSLQIKTLETPRTNFGNFERPRLSTEKSSFTTEDDVECIA